MTKAFITFCIIFVISAPLIIGAAAFAVHSSAEHFWNEHAQQTGVNLDGTRLAKFATAASDLCSFDCVFTRMTWNQMSEAAIAAGQGRPNPINSIAYRHLVALGFKDSEMQRLIFDNLWVGSTRQGQRIRGYPAAAQYYFRKSFEDLAPAEVADLMTIAYFSNTTNPFFVNQRNQILDSMFQHGLITETLRYHEKLRSAPQ